MKMVLANTRIDLYGASNVDCDGVCLNDADEDGTCDEDEDLDEVLTSSTMLSGDVGLNHLASSETWSLRWWRLSATLHDAFDWISALDLFRILVVKAPVWWLRLT